VIHQFNDVDLRKLQRSRAHLKFITTPTPSKGAITGHYVLPKFTLLFKEGRVVN
jgi:hypothetical protein